MPNITFFSVGEVLPDGVTEILSRTGYLYHIRTLCCGHEEDVKHGVLKERVSPHRLEARVYKEVCGRCARGYETAARARRREEEEARIRAGLERKRRNRWPMPHNAWPKPVSACLRVWGVQV